jgi:hypothetical protein
MGQTEHYHIPWPDGPGAADGPNGFEDIALATEAGLAATLTENKAVAFTPSWSSQGAQQPNIGNGSKTGYYTVRNGWCTFVANIWFGTTTSGGTGFLQVGLPVAANSTLEQELPCKLWCPAAYGDNGGGNFLGFVHIAPSAYGSCVPWLPYSRSSTVLGGWRNCDESASPTTGIPFIDSAHYNVSTINSNPGAFTSGRNGNFMYGGTYLVA